jgi:hypothetical protein
VFRLLDTTLYLPTTNWNLNATMSVTTSSHPQATTQRVNTPTLLGIPAELRNLIYDHVFLSQTKHSLAPHALTRVCSCIRRESLAMYYASVRCKPLEILLHHPSQFRHVTRWLAELDTDRYPTLPDIEFSWTEYRSLGIRKFGLRCARLLTTLDNAFPVQIDWCDKTGVPSSRIVVEALEQTYDYCLGLSKVNVWIPPVPSGFKEAVFDEESEIFWTVRHLSLLPGSWRDLRIPMFVDLATRKNGRDWEICDLRYVIKSLENAVGNLKPPANTITTRNDRPIIS